MTWQTHDFSDLEPDNNYRLRNTVWNILQRKITEIQLTSLDCRAFQAERNRRDSSGIKTIHVRVFYLFGRLLYIGNQGPQPKKVVVKNLV